MLNIVKNSFLSCFKRIHKKLDDLFMTKYDIEYDTDILPTEDKKIYECSLIDKKIRTIRESRIQEYFYKIEELMNNNKVNHSLWIAKIEEKFGKKYNIQNLPIDLLLRILEDKKKVIQIGQDNLLIWRCVENPKTRKFEYKIFLNIFLDDHLKKLYESYSPLYKPIDSNSDLVPVCYFEYLFKSYDEKILNDYLEWEKTRVIKKI